MRWLPSQLLPIGGIGAERFKAIAEKFLSDFETLVKTTVPLKHLGNESA
jgi:hypothetical protein